MKKEKRRRKGEEQDRCRTGWGREFRNERTEKRTAKVEGGHASTKRRRRRRRRRRASVI
jgi:hypothetical protein